MTANAIGSEIGGRRLVVSSLVAASIALMLVTCGGRAIDQGDAAASCSFSPPDASPMNCLEFPVEVKGDVAACVQLDPNGRVTNCAELCGTSLTRCILTSNLKTVRCMFSCG